MSQSQSDCLKSAQYRVIQNLYDKLVEAVSPEIDVVLAKAWSKNVIGKQQLDTSLEPSSSTHRKATVFISGIASRIKVDSSAFEVFLSLLEEVPSLHYIVELLESELRNEITGIVGDRSQSTSSHLSSTSVVTLEPIDETASEEVDDPTRPLLQDRRNDGTTGSLEDSNIELELQPLPQETPAGQSTEQASRNSPTSESQPPLQQDSFVVVVSAQGSLC